MGVRGGPPATWKDDLKLAGIVLGLLALFMVVVWINAPYYVKLLEILLK